MSAEKPNTPRPEEGDGADMEDMTELPPLLQSDEYDAELPLDEREGKWGFTLEELRSASKVVRTLFLNPALFIGDPYLSDSRLYTMITRCRQKKREFREVYKTIMSEEKSRRKKYIRSQTVSAIGLTLMKREREDALSALMLQDDAAASPLLLRDAPEEGSTGAAATRKEGAPADDSLSAEDKGTLRLVGAFENVLRLERCLAGREHFESTYPTTAAAAEEAAGEEPVLVTGGASAPASPTADRAPADAKTNDKKREKEEGSGTAAQSPAVDWAAASQLAAQAYRYVPHVFGSQMPPPLFVGPVPPGLTARERLYYARGYKLQLAREAARLRGGDSAPEAKRAKAEDAAKSVVPLTEAARRGAGGEWVAVIDPANPPKDAQAQFHEAMDACTSVAALRALVAQAGEQTDTATEAAIDGAAAAAYERIAVRTGETAEAILDAIEQTLLDGAAGCESFWCSSGSATVPVSKEVAAACAECTLNLFLARSLYRNPRLRAFGASPVVVDRVAPTSDSQEPDVWSVFDDLQVYATAHHDGDGLQLTSSRACYICKVRFERLHPYYYSMCHLCSEFNYNKRLVARDLRGKVVLLTGCRIKIGFAMALSLLRCGAIVLGTTRFAHEAVARFRQETDYDEWKDRLHLYSLDLRDLWVVTQFCGFVRQHFPKVFAIVNNAAQTIARTPQYTEHLRRIEIDPAPELRAAIQQDSTADEWHSFFLNHTAVTVGKALSIEHQPTAQPFLAADGDDNEEEEEGQQQQQSHKKAAEEAAGDKAAAQVTLKQQPATAPTGLVEAAGPGSTTLVFDRYDTQAEESDHRTTNSWVMKLAEVQGSEAAEVMAINALAPFILNSKLKPCLTNRDGDAVPNEARFVINVSAMEGQFYRYKQTTHPHTNMAKAALNMMTRTSAEDYAQDGIYMNSVDTGWITDESPKLKKERRADQFLLCPLDEVDAAARCLDLIYTDSRVYGHFYKDFKSIPW